MVTTENRSIKDGSLDRTEKLLKVVFLIVTLPTTLLKSSEWISQTFFPDKRYEITWTITLALISVAITIAVLFSEAIPLIVRAITICLQKIPQKLSFIKRFADQIKMILDKTPRAALIGFYILLLFLVVYFVTSRTDIWRAARSVFAGPQINLRSAAGPDTFQPAINLPWVIYGQDFGQVAQWGWRGVSRNPGVVEDSLKRLRKSGVRYVTWFLLCDGRASLEFDAKGHVTGLDPDFFKDYNTAIDLAGKHDIGIVWVLLDYYLMFPGQVKNGAPIFGHADLIEDEEKRKSFIDNALKPILRRSAYAPEIFGWILINEPENALKDGYVSPDAVQAFVGEAARLIKENNSRQPVSIANADLESLVEYSGRYSSNVDFFIFHHYEPFLPPPVSHIRSLMQGGRDKAIYIGEFDINNPPLPIDKLVAWSQRLGNAGLWPWNSGANRGADNGLTPSPYGDEAKLISDTIIGNNHHIDDQFEKRHTSDARSLTTNFRQDMNWWREYWSEKVIPQIQEKISKWSVEISEHQKEYEKNQKFERDTVGWIDKIGAYIATKQRESIEANKSLAQAISTRHGPSIVNSQRWVAEVEAEIKKKKGRTSDQKAGT